MRILITNYHCASNRGDAAIVEGLISSLQKAFPDPEFTVATEYPDASSIIHGVESIEQRTTPFRVREIKKNAARLYSLFGADLQKRGITPPKFEYVLERMNLKGHLESDLVIGTGGHYITDIYFPGKIGILWELYFAKRLGKPVVLAAQSAGPFEEEKYRELTSRVLNRIDLITTRDKQTKENLESIGVSDTPIHFTADAAFSMEQRDDAGPIENDRYEVSELPSSDLDISISAREWPHFDDPDGRENYVDALSRAADRLSSTEGAKIRFISTCTGFDGYHTDDRIIAHEIIRRMENSAEATVLYGEYTPRELVEIYGKMDVHIGTRMHSNILAIMGGTPVVPIQYQFKTEGLARQFNIERYLIDINDISYEKLLENTREVISNRAQIEERIGDSLPEIKRRSKRNAELVYELMDR